MTQNLGKEAKSPFVAVKNYYRNALIATIVISIVFILFLIVDHLFSSLIPLTGTFAAISILILFLINKITSICYYSFFIKEKYEQGVKNKFLLPFRWMLFCIILGLTSSTTLVILIHPSFFSGLIFILFTTGSFLSFGSKTSPRTKNYRETIAITITLIIAVSLSIILYIIGGHELFFLNSLRAISSTTIWGIMPVVSIIFTTLGFAQYLAKAIYYWFNWNKKCSPSSVFSADLVFWDEKSPLAQERPWEFRLAFIGLTLGLFLSAGIFILGWTPFGGGLEVNLFTCVMVCAALPSMLSKIGKSIDEIQKNQRILLNSPSKMGDNQLLNPTNSVFSNSSSRNTLNSQNSASNGLTTNVNSLSTTESKQALDNTYSGTVSNLTISKKMPRKGSLPLTQSNVLEPALSKPGNSQSLNNMNNASGNLVIKDIFDNNISLISETEGFSSKDNNLGINNYRRRSL